MGAAVPARSMSSGLEAASLSMTRVPESAREWQGEIAGGDLVERAVGKGDGAGLMDGEGGAAGGGGEEGPLAGDAADGEWGGSRVGEGEGLGGGLAGGYLAEV